MTAFELADWLDAMDIDYDTQAAALLRKQAEAIKTLRLALKKIAYIEVELEVAEDTAIKALAATEELQ